MKKTKRAFFVAPLVFLLVLAGVPAPASAATADPGANVTINGAVVFHGTRYKKSKAGTFRFTYLGAQSNACAGGFGFGVYKRSNAATSSQYSNTFQTSGAATSQTRTLTTKMNNSTVFPAGDWSMTSRHIGGSRAACGGATTTAWKGKLVY